MHSSGAASYQLVAVTLASRLLLLSLHWVLQPGSKMTSYIDFLLIHCWFIQMKKKHVGTILSPKCTCTPSFDFRDFESFWTILWRKIALSSPNQPHMTHWLSLRDASKISAFIAKASLFSELLFSPIAGPVGASDLRFTGRINTCVPLSPSSIIWYRYLFGLESNCGPGGK